VLYLLSSPFFTSIECLRPASIVGSLSTRPLNFTSDVPTSYFSLSESKPTLLHSLLFFIQQPRLTDRALAKDVTALLRGKFGLPQQVTADEGRHHSQYHKSPQRERELSFGQSFTSSLARRLSPSSTKKHQKVTRSDSESGSDGRQSSNFSTLDSDYPYMTNIKRRLSWMH